ncbi:amidase family protein [Paenibacillus piscarius]|uniref:amidase family protein n=1 Tax=Paenibacillus piscarius TaxID=1089681 RepID=UPI001EE8979D|nr:amidase family protein [Paenibacillus piscarius]
MALHNQHGAFRLPELEVTGSGQGPLKGLSFAVKDVFAVAGHRSSAGNPDWLRTHEPAADHAPVVRRLLEAGADLRGAAHTDELMYSLGGENYHYGTPVNPHGKDRVPGGSSSGSAVAVAAGSVDFALGTDTGGSVRVPSSYCGVFGFRPTHGAVPLEGVIPLAPGFDTVGWIAGSAELLLKVGRVLLAGADSGKDGSVLEAGADSGGAGRVLKAGTNSGGPGLARMFVPPECWALAEPDGAAFLKRGLEQLQAGASLQAAEAAIAPEGLKAWMDAFRELQGAEIWAAHGGWIGRERPAFGPDIAARFAWAAGLAGADLRRAGGLRRRLAERLRRLLGNDGCLVIPTVPGPAPLRGAPPDQLERDRSGAMRLCCIAGLAGLPQVTLPVPGPGGLPLGLSVIGGHGQDLRLLSWIQEVWKQ